MRTLASVTLALTLAAVTGATGCGGSDPPEAVPVLIAPSAERVEVIYGRGDEGTAATAYELHPPGLADGATVERYVERCAARERVEPEVAAADDTQGLVHAGTEPVELPPPPPGNILRTVEGNPEYLDPNLTSESAGGNIGMQMFETLLVPAPGNTPPRPGAARDYEVSDDGRVYTFHIREGMTWSDGRPLNAHDFRYAWLRGLRPETGSRNAQTLWKIKGAQAYNEGKTTDQDSVGVRVPDDHTLVVELESAAPYFPDLVTYIAYAPVPRHIVETHGKRWTRPEHIVSNGPFVMKDWQQRARITLEKNPRYWDADNVALDGVIYHSSDSEQQAVNLYASGEIHWARPLPTDQVKEWVDEGREDLRIAELMCTYYYVYRIDRPPFDDGDVRRAFNMAVDKQALADHVVGGYVRPSSHLVPDMFRGTLGYVPPEGDPHDASGARAILAKAGYPSGAGLPAIDIIYNTFEGHKLIAEYISAQLRNTLGVRVTSRNMEWKSLLKQAHAGDFTIARTSWCADYPDPTTFLGVFHSGGENNYAGYKNPAFDALLDRIDREPDREARNDLMCAAEMVLNRDLPVMPIYAYTRAYLLRPEVEGLLPQYQDSHYMKWVSLKPGGGR